MNYNKDERNQSDDSIGMKRTEKLREIKSKLVALVSSDENDNS
jgi:hypothetical protein